MSQWVPDLLVYVELPEDLGCVQEMLVLEDPATVSNCLGPMSPLNLHILLRVPSQQRQVQDKRHPVSVDQE
jgi:hypothetical protein